MKLVIVEWVDSAFMQGWMSKEHAKEHNYSRITSVGILLKETKDYITIVQSVSDKGDAGDDLTIPRCALERIRILRVK